MAQIVTTKDGKRHEFPDAATPDQMKAALASYASKMPLAPAGPNQMSPQEMFGPKAMTRRWLRAIPFAAGTAGAMLPPPLGGLAGATGGGILGRGIERGLAGESLDLKSPDVRKDIMGAGVKQAALQAPASAIGPVGQKLIGLRGWARSRAVNQAIKEVNLPRAAGRATRVAELSRRVPEATAARQGAASETKAAIDAAQGQEITVADIANEIINNREARFNVTISPKVRSQIVHDIRSRIPRVMNSYTGRAIGGKSTVFDMPTSQVGKQAFDDLVRAAHTGREGGIKPRPSVDMDIANAWRDLIEARVPSIKDLNKATSGAIKTEQSLKRMQKNLPTQEAQDIRTKELDASTAARVIAQRSANPFQLFKGIPVRGGFARPGLSLRPGTFSEALGKVGDVFTSAPAEKTAFYSPRAIALLTSLLYNSGTMPPDTLNNGR